MTTYKNVDEIIEDIIKTEGGYVDDSKDLGGATNFGITETVARANGYFGTMKDMPKTTAKQIYLNKYWIEPGFDKISNYSFQLAADLCDTGVNMGTSFPRTSLQKCLNLLNRQEKDYKNISEDGAIGPATLTALASFLAKRSRDGETVLRRMLMGLRVARYIDISTTRPANQEFLFGWINNRIVFQ